MKSLIKKLLKEGLNKKQYLGQCDTLRRKCSDNEEYWQDMMKNRMKIPFKTFINSVDMSKMLDIDEKPINFISDAIRTDKSTATYESNWGDKPAMFLQTSGFEFIFV